LSALVPSDETILDPLERAIRWSQGFTLLFVQCNAPIRRDALRQSLAERFDPDVVLSLRLERSIVSLREEIRQHWNETKVPIAVEVVGLEASILDHSPVLGRLNHDRELLRQTIPCALILWMPEFALDCVARGAPDFWAWRSGVFEVPDVSPSRLSTSIEPQFLDWRGLASLGLEEKQDALTQLDSRLKHVGSEATNAHGGALVRSLLLQKASLMTAQGAYAEALSVLRDVLQRAIEADDKADEANALHNLGSIEFRVGRYAAARELTEKSLEIAQRIGHRAGEAAGLHQLAVIASEQGQSQQAREYFAKSLSVTEAIGDLGGKASILQHLANIDLEEGKADSARIMANQSLALREKLGEKAGIASALHLLASIDMSEGNSAAARKRLSESLMIRQALGDRPGIAATMHQLGSIELAEGNLRSAAEAFKRSLQENQALDNRAGIAHSLHQLAIIALLIDRQDLAVPLLGLCYVTERSLGVAESPGVRHPFLDLTSQLGLPADFVQKLMAASEKDLPNDRGSRLADQLLEFVSSKSLPGAK